ncbi:MAG: hypothetical protein MUP53_04090, partial [Bacteroidales bacterium]|nr:hypothetical protein [Bacteroidales bacterium]
GIIAFLLAVVPCVGIIAVIPAIIAIVLAIIGLSRPGTNQGMLIGGLVVAALALMISLSQTELIGKIAEKSGGWATDIEKAVKDITDDIEKEFGSNDITIRVDKDDESVEIKASTRRDDLKNKLDELEEGPVEGDSTVTDTVR